MGNSKSKKAKSFELYEDFDGFYYDDYQPQNSTQHKEVVVNFDELPEYKLPDFLKDAKIYIRDKKKEFQKDKSFDPIALLDVMNTILTERDYKTEESKAEGAAIWAGGVGFGGGSTDDYNAKKRRDLQYDEANEREYVLIHAFSLFSSAINTVTPKMQRRTRRLFNRSAIRHELGEYLVNDSMLDITKHSWFYWYAWKMLLSLATAVNLRASIFRGGFYLHMQKLIEVAEVYKKRMDKMPANVKGDVPGMRLVDEIIYSRAILERHYLAFKEEKILTPMRDSNSAVSTIDVVHYNGKSAKQNNFSRKRRAQTMCDVNAAEDVVSAIDTSVAEPKNSPKKLKNSKSKQKQTKKLRVDGKKDPVKEKEETAPRPSNGEKGVASVESPDKAHSEVEANKEVEKEKAVVSVPKKKRKRKKKSNDVKQEVSEYVRVLSELIFDSSSFPSHIFAQRSAALAPGALNRTMLEIQSLADSLPTCLTNDSGIYLRTNDEHLHLMKALIVGPPGTPYSMGLFEFDIMIPNNYPASPPLCKIVTTGNQTFRFNPNLYANGKVCLSLIGTWSGAPEEQWDPKVSTLLQVFISIQSLILVENPYYNEPGYQFSANDQANLDYNSNIQRGTTRLAILGQLRDKQSVFKDVIRNHCRLKCNEILQQAKEWNIEASLLKDLTEELEAL